MSEELKPAVTAIADALAAAKAATRHVLSAICDDPAKYWLLGSGTGSWALLTKAHAELWECDVKEVPENFRPEKARYDRYCKDREQKERLLDHCRDQGITLPAEEEED